MGTLRKKMKMEGVELGEVSHSTTPKPKPEKKLNNTLMKKIRELNPGAGSQYNSYEPKGEVVNEFKKLDAEVQKKVREDKEKYRLEQLEEMDEQRYKWTGLHKTLITVSMHH